MQVFDVLTEEMGPIFDDRNVQRNGGNWEYHSHPADGGNSHPPTAGLPLARCLDSDSDPRK